MLTTAEEVVAPMSFAQERLWLTDRIAPGEATYNVRRAVRFRGSLDRSALEAAVAAVAGRHESLRTRFELVDDVPMQVVADQVRVPLAFADVSALPLEGREATARTLLAREGARPFDLREAPLLRALVVRLAADDHVFLVTMHHIVTDEWSSEVFGRELAFSYAAYRAGEEPALPELPVQYVDFAVWQREWLQGRTLERQLAYWRERLDGAPARTELPADRLPGSGRGSAGASVSFSPAPALAEGLRRLARAHGATSFVTLLAAFTALLYRYTGRDDLVVGSPIANRPRRELEGLIGFFVNTLALRTQVDGEAGFDALLVHVRDRVLEAFDHQDLPFEKLVAELQPERTPGVTPYVNVLFVMRDKRGGGTSLPGLHAEAFALDEPPVKFDLTLHVTEAENGFRCAFQYDAGLFDERSMLALAGHFETLLQAAVAEPSRALRTLPLVTVSERDGLLRASEPIAPLACTRTVLDAFAAHALRQPGSIAVTCGAERLTYAELDGRANALAHRLRSRGVGPGVGAAIALDRSLELVVAIVAVLKAGGYYVPLDPSYPPDRLRAILEDARPAVVVTAPKLAARVPASEARLVLPDAGSAQPACPKPPAGGAGLDDVAYAIYTSGSTGRPKGVTVTQRNLARLLLATQGELGFGAADVWTLFHSYAFDVSVWEMWGAFAHGGRLVVVPYALSRAPAEFHALLAAQRVTVLCQTPSAFRELMRVDAARPQLPPSLRLVVLGGEMLEPRRLADWFARYGDERPQLVNMYGPTETTVFATLRTLSLADVTSAIRSPIGRPLSDTAAYVLDEAGAPVPERVAGELYVGGPGVAQGYLHRPELTAERFLPSPFRKGERLYRTGDRVRRLPGGELEYLGRLDRQVKIRGFRIEPGDVEAALLALPGVREAVVVARSNDATGEARLIAYVRDDAKPPRERENWHRSLAERLPAYMLPSAFVRLDVLPLTPSGKLDHAALPEPPAVPGATRARRPVRLTNALYYLLIEVWENVLNVRPVGFRDDFFEIGGHSLLAVRMLAEVERAFGRVVPLGAFLEEPTIERLARLLVEGDERDTSSPLLVLREGGSAAPFFYLHGDVSGGGYYARRLARALDPDRPFYVLPPHGTNGRPFPNYVEAMAEDYLAFVTAARPHGPYVLGGFCSGGLVAFELARRLRARGETVEDVILIDCAGTNCELHRFAEAVDRFAAVFPVSAERCLRALAFVAGVRRRILKTLHPARARARIRRLRTLPADVLRRRVGSRVRRAMRVASGLGPQTDLEGTWRAISGNYVQRRYPGRVTLLVPRPDGVLRDGDALRRWRDVADDVEAYAISGAHLTCITQYVDETGQRLNACLQRGTRGAARDAARQETH